MRSAPSASVRAIAKAAGVSKSTVGYVIQNRPGPSAKMRERVWKIARRLGYVPDARVAQTMASVRRAKEKELLPVAWLNATAEVDSWHKHSYLMPYLRGMRKRCHELGYRVEELWLNEPGMTMRRLSQILYQRGIEGVVITPEVSHVRLKWEKLAAVTLGAQLLAPRLHRIDADSPYNLMLALKMVSRFGFRRVGICLSKLVDRVAHHLLSVLAREWQPRSGRPNPVPPLFHDAEAWGRNPVPRDVILAWVRRYKPEVIICHDNRITDWLEEAGYAVPRQIGVVHLAIDDDVLDWAGIYTNKETMGRTAAELVVSQVQARQFGVPAVALKTVIQGEWRNGRTLRTSVRR